MENIKSYDNMVLDTIFARSSIRAYKDDPLTSEQISTLADAALASPTAMNAQKQRFYFITDKDFILEWERFVCEDIEKNSTDAMKQKMADRKGKVFYNAPLVVVIAVDNSGNFAQCDSGIAAAHLALAAKSMGLDSVILGLPKLAFKEHGDRIREKLGMDDNLDFAIAVSIGYAAMDKAPHDTDSTHVIYIDK